MRTKWRRGLIVGAVVCLVGTEAREGRAEDSQGRRRWEVEGVTARLGTSVGFSELARHRWSMIGGHLAMGYRLGSVALEAELDSTELLFYTGETNVLKGSSERAGLVARVFLAELSPSPSSQSKLWVFADGVVGVQTGTLQGLSFRRTDKGGGLGWLLEHYVRPRGIGVESIGWHFGWRLTSADRADEAMARVVCGKKCPTPMSPDDRGDLQLNVSSSLALSW